MSGVKVARISSGRFCGTTGSIFSLQTEKARDAKTSRPKVRMVGDGADLPIGAMKVGNSTGAKGQNQNRWCLGQLSNKEEP